MMHIPAPAEWRKSSRSTTQSNCVEVCWRKSSRSSSASNCVEVAWRKSSRSTNASNCVEVAFTDLVAVRDSKNAEGPTVTFSRVAWSAFVRR